MNEQKLFYCYSNRLHNWLRALGFKYISIGVNKNTNKNYWTYEKSNKLDTAIDLYNQIKHVFETDMPNDYLRSFTVSIKANRM